ncbi:hypothetical protein [Actinokineospora sp. UTMC 2448]|uniref:hypothetical protein n=1 Tax=Actinokineospora sp. UTMC 2448 TaxID=2268449 RepID=UPI0021646CCD|nr:hypothetical protein [Actinokineospora sp. UTMC 2448]UVS81438.1 hypothetical protein Actkin_05196 [Actinokineospora sp. UTMC 2448]
MAAGAACVAALSAVWAAYNGRRTLANADRDRTEKSRPVLAAEFRLHQYSDRTLLFCVKNHGQTVARNVRVEFTPSIEPEDSNFGVRATLIRKFAKPISVLAPGAELDTLYFTPDFTGDEVVNAEGLPDELRVTISYDGPSIKRRFGPDHIHRYEDTFDLDTIPVRARVWANSSTEPSSRLKDINNNLAKLTKAVQRLHVDNER